jgi:hypothetical protein
MFISTWVITKLLLIFVGLEQAISWHKSDTVQVLVDSSLRNWVQQCVTTHNEGFCPQNLCSLWVWVQESLCIKFWNMDTCTAHCSYQNHCLTISAVSKISILSSAVKLNLSEIHFRNQLLKLYNPLCLTPSSFWINNPC